jgi:hypothetical protein
MSGGSYNYLFCKEVPDLFSASSLQDMEQIEAALLSCGYKDIAKDVRRLIEYINSAENRISVLHEQLSGVFKAIEWHDSGDWGKDSLHKALDAYRSGEKEGQA